ncbi:hypothetical protein PILCRDRAFT_817211, partial [Piloderma croceum F 1598]
MTQGLGYPFSAAHDTTNRLVCNVGDCTIGRKFKQDCGWYQVVSARTNTRHKRIRCKHMPKIRPKPRRIRNTETADRMPGKALVPSGCLFEADRIKRPKTLTCLQDMATFSVSGLKIFCRSGEVRRI